MLIILIGCKEKHNRIIVISDLHYLSQSLYNNSSYFDEMMKHADAKITAYSDLLLDSLIEDIKDLNVDAIILLGDMSFNGEKISHEELSKRFKELNLPILAIPGNHDLNNIYAREYKGKGYTSTETIGKEEFEGIDKVLLGTVLKQSGFEPYIGEEILSIIKNPFYQEKLSEIFKGDMNTNIWRKIP